MAIYKLNYNYNSLFILAITNNNYNSRIAKAIREGHSFKCIVIFPQPEEVGRWALPTLQKELRTARQLLIKLQEHFPHSPIENYISFLQLRNYGFLDNKILSDQVY